MAYVSSLENTIVLGVGEIEPSSAARWLSPILLGLSIPAILALLFLQEVVRNSQPLIFFVMAIMLALSIIAYIVTVFVPGETIRMRILKSENSVEILTAGPFAVSRRLISFKDVANLQAIVQYDHDGYAENVAQLKTSDGEIISVPMIQSIDEFNFARKAMGMSTRR